MGSPSGVFWPSGWDWTTTAWPGEPVARSWAALTVWLAIGAVVPSEPITAPGAPGNGAGAPWAICWSTVCTWSHSTWSFSWFLGSTVTGRVWPGWGHFLVDTMKLFLTR